MSQDSTTLAGSPDASAELVQKALLLRQFANSRRARHQPTASRRAARSSGRHRHFAQAIASQHSQSLGAQSLRFLQSALSVRDSAISGSGPSAERIYRRQPVAVARQSAGSRQPITVSLDLHQLLQTINIHLNPTFTTLNLALKVEQAVTHVRNQPLVITPLDTASSYPRTETRDLEAARQLFIHNVQLIQRTIRAVSTPQKQLDPLSDRHNLSVSSGVYVLAEHALSLSHEVFPPVVDAVRGDGSERLNWMLHEGNFTHLLHSRFQAGTTKSVIVRDGSSRNTVYELIPNRAPLVPASPIMSIWQQPGFRMTGDHTSVQIYHMGSNGMQLLVRHMGNISSPAQATHTGKRPSGEARHIDSVIERRTASQVVLNQALRKIDPTPVQWSGTKRFGTRVVQMADRHLVDEMQSLPGSFRLMHASHLSPVRSAGRSDLAGHLLAAAIPGFRNDSTIAGTQQAQLTTALPMTRRTIASELLRIRRQTHENQGATSVRVAHSLQPATYLHPPSSSYVFAQQARASVSEPQITSRIEKQEIVEVVKKEVQTMMTPRNVMMNFSRTDYAQIADQVYSTLMRQMLLERERLGLRA